MTLSNLLPLSPPPQPSWQQATNFDRTDWSSGGWKKGKGNPNAALSALTLLAFLFFLNILQNCLKESIGQNGMMVVMLPNQTAIRGKREAQPEFIDCKDNVTPICFDTQLKNRINHQVESYWSSKNIKYRKKFLNKKSKTNTNIQNSFFNLEAVPESIMNETQDKPKIPDKIMVNHEAELKKTKNEQNMKKENTKKQNFKNTTLSTTLSPKAILSETINAMLKFPRPNVAKLFCCHMIVCQTKKLKQEERHENLQIYKFIRTISRLCSTLETTTCDNLPGHCNSPLAESVVKTLWTFLGSS